MTDGIAVAQATSRMAVWIRRAARDARQGDGFRKGSTHPTDYRFFELFRAMAARISVLKAVSFISSPSWRSMARRGLPSRLELNSALGSLSEAPLAKVSLTTLL